MNIEAFRFPPDWELYHIRDAYTFTQKPRGLNLKKKGMREGRPLSRILSIAQQCKRTT